MQMTTSNDDHSPQFEKSTRGLTSMKKVFIDRSKGRKCEVGWNERGQPIEPNASKLMSVIGLTVRKMVSITCDSWKNPDLDDIKDKIWTEIQSVFVVDDIHRKFVLKEAGKLHRAFRAFLTKKHLRDVNGNINNHPPEKYASIISEEDWRVFIAKRLSDSYQNLSNLNRKRASNPVYPYKRSRIGYAVLEQRMLQETGSELKTMPRHLLWKAGRVNKKQVIDNENVQKVWEECENLSQFLSGEEVEAAGRNDILAQVLNSPEYPGRVRGVGFGVSQKDYFPPQKRVKPEDVELLKAMMDTVLMRLKKLEERDSTERQLPDSSIHNAKDSCTPAYQNLPKGISPCQLYLLSPHYRVVGKGKVFNKSNDDKLHNQELPIGHIKVSVEVAVEPNAPLPVPIDHADFTVVGDAIGTFVAWPVNLIEIGEFECQKIVEETPKRSVVATNKDHEKLVIQQPSPVAGGSDLSTHHKKLVIQERSPVAGGSDLSTHRSSLKKYVREHMGPTDMKNIAMDESVFGFSFQENIRRNEIYELLHHELIGTTVINIYIRYLYEQLICPNGLTKRFSFISPHLTSSYEDDREQKVANVLLKHNEKGKLIFAPYNVGRHWVLIAINATAGVVYYMDSSGGDYGNYQTMKDMFNTAMKIYRTQRGTKASKKSKSRKISWTKIKCPGQTNEIDCGYYVLRYMKEIMTVNQTKIPVDYFPDYMCTSYSEDKLVEVMEEWSRYLLENVIG